MSDDIQAQLANLRAMLGEFARDQKLMLRKLNELANSYTINLTGTKLITSTRGGQRMFIDGRDTGSGLSVVTHGFIEPNVMKVLQRAFTPEAVFLDIGANFGFYSIMAGGQVGREGKVYAFEANPNLIPYIERSAYINGLGKIVTIINKAVSDREGTADFGFSFTEIGGGSLAKGMAAALAGSTDQSINVPLVRIDDVLPADLVVDCAKLDLEGNELAALRGMRNVVARSPNIQLVIEFFPPLLGGADGAAQVLDILTEMGLNYWLIDESGHLASVSRDALLHGGDCYLAASRARPNDRSLVLRKNALRLPTAPDDAGFLLGPAGAVLTHGPYWHLQRGSYRAVVEGEIEGALDISVTHEFGFANGSGRIDASQRSLDFGFIEDARYFEVVLRSTGPDSKLRLEAIVIEER
jgi:FkbM family methyltransferase